MQQQIYRDFTTHIHDTWAFYYYYMNAKFIYCDSDKQLCQAQTKSNTKQAHRGSVSHLLQTIHPLCVRECCWIFSILTTRKVKKFKLKKLQPCCRTFIYSFCPPFPRFIGIIFSFYCNFFMFALKPKNGWFPVVVVAANN